MFRRFALAIAVFLAVVAAILTLRLHAVARDLAGKQAKVLCSAIFVSGRALEEARAHSLPLEFPGTEFTVAADSVRVRVPGGIERLALYRGEQGCVALPPGATDPHAALRGLEPPRGTPPPADRLPWPMGDRVEDAFPHDLDRSALERAVEVAFADPAALTTAFLVVHRGTIVAERYAPPFDRDTRFESWSMGKSLTAALIGRLAQLGWIDLSAPIGLAEWSEPSDPRSRITPIHLLRMSSGLEFSGATQSLSKLLFWGTPDHIAIYMGMDDVFDFALAAPAEHQPGSTGRYRNSDPLALGARLRRTLEARGESYLHWPHRELLDRIGARRFVLETDARGNYILTGFDYVTARDWARLGLLFLQDGVWLGQRLLPEGFVELVSTPAPAWPEPVYGGAFWLNRTGRVPGLPASAYWMGGHGQQRVTIVPSHDLVVVRMGHTQGNLPAGQALAEALAGVVEAVPVRSPRAD